MLLPVIAITGLSAWTLVSGPIRAMGQSPQIVLPLIVASHDAALPDPKANPTEPVVPTESALPTVPETAAPATTPTIEVPPVNGLKISSQSWRRGGLGSKALVTFTLRNNNDYAVRDVEVACAFARRDGSHLTDRTRIVPGTVEMKSRKTFARLHIGFVNVNANKAKCAPVAANRI